MILIHFKIQWVVLDLCINTICVDWRTSIWKMPTSVMWRRADLVWTDVSGGMHLNVSADTCSRWFLARGFFYPEDGGDTFLRKRRFTQDLHGATSQKTAFFVINAVKISILQHQYELRLYHKTTFITEMSFLLFMVLWCSYTQNVSGSLTDFQGWSLTRISFRHWKQ
jgi:hypothetical protein